MSVIMKCLEKPVGTNIDWGVLKLANHRNLDDDDDEEKEQTDSAPAKKFGKQNLQVQVVGSATPVTG